MIIGGSGPDKERLVVLAAGDKRIKFSGFIPEENMNEFYNSLDYFVFPSKSEGYGLPIVEAFACKKPVVVMNDGMIPGTNSNTLLVVDNLLECAEKAKL